MGFHIRNIDHVVVRVADMDQALRFYCEVLGCAVAKRRDDLGMIHLHAGSAMIDLVDIDGQLGRMGGAAPGAEGRNMDHFCVRVDPFDESEVRAHLLAHDIEPGPTVARFGAEGTGRSVYVEDPDGNTVELKGPADA